jgi:4-carboxymuconolactone decarboxylase
MSAGARVPLVEPGTRPELAAIERSITAERGHLSAIYQALLNSAPLGEGWEKLLTAIRNKSSLPPDVRELVILQAAVLNRAPFEFGAHLPVARKVGVAEPKLTPIQSQQIGEPFSALEKAVLALADANPRLAGIGRAVRTDRPKVRCPGGDRARRDDRREQHGVALPRGSAHRALDAHAITSRDSSLEPRIAEAVSVRKRVFRIDAARGLWPSAAG